MHQSMSDAAYLYARVRSDAEKLGCSQTLRVLPLARQWHAGQYRKGAQQLPYITHPLTMACHALALGFTDDALLSALLLHDVPEDCGIPVRDLPVDPLTRDAVALVTFSRLPGESHADAKARYFAAIRENDLACLVKVIDRCHNVSCMAKGFTRERMAQYVAETDAYVLPLLDTLDTRRPEYAGALWAIRYQLESLLDTFRHLL